MPRTNATPTSEVSLRRYYRNHELGEGIPEIAKSEGVEEETVRQSIHSVQLYRTRHKVEHAHEAMVGVVLNATPKVQRTLDKVLTAKTEITDAAGKVRKVDDLSMQLRGVEMVKGIIQTVQPRGPSTAVQINNANMAHAQSARVATSSYVGMEDMLTEIMKEQQTQPAPEQRQLTGAKLESVRGEYVDTEEADEEE
jgi:hypothetical protein